MTWGATFHRGFVRDQRLRLALCLLLVIAHSAGCTTRYVYNVGREPLNLGSGATRDDVRRHIERAAKLRDWTIEEVDPETLFVTKRRGQHAAVATVWYSEKAFSIQYRDSSQLRHGGDRIHRLYNVWIQSLESGIRVDSVGRSR